MKKTIRRIHCGSSTRPVYQPIQSKFRQSIIVLNKAPLHYCIHCNERLISLEALSAFRYLKAIPLKSGINEFDFELVFTKVQAQNGAG